VGEKGGDEIGGRRDDDESGAVADVQAPIDNTVQQKAVKKGIKSEAASTFRSH